MTKSLRDAHGRRISDLRLSLTDRCQMRCQYCMPQDQKFVDHAALLRPDEIGRLIKALIPIGLNKIRFTGGEPMVRPQFAEIAGLVRSLAPEASLNITTNALLLDRYLDLLNELRFESINISVDALDRQAFQDISHHQGYDQVWEHIKMAAQHFQGAVKLNVVLLKGVNDQIENIVSLARLVEKHPWEVRFIEYMPEGIWSADKDRIVRGEDVRAMLKQQLYIEEASEQDLGAPVRRWRVPGQPGVLGFIDPVSRPFCGWCRRIRVTATGQIKACLLHEDYVDLKAYLQSDDQLSQVQAQFQKAADRKPEGHEGYRRFKMNTVGG